MILTYSLKFIITQSSLQQITKLVIPASVKVSSIILSNSGDFVSQDFLKSFLFIWNVNVHGWHKIADSICWLEWIDHLSSHGLPHVLVLEVPGYITNSIILLYICEKALMVKNTSNLSVKPVNPGVIHSHFLPSKRLPENYFWPLLNSIFSGKDLSLKDPSMASLSISSDADISIKSKSNEQIAKEDGVIFGVSTSSSQETLHWVPDLNLLTSRCLKPLERYQADKPGSMERRI